MAVNAKGGAGADNSSVYYTTGAATAGNLGNYQFITLGDIVGNFIAAYIGEGKILANALKGDVKFHAHRALQELSYDTLKSCKSQEIVLPPSLQMPLPHDYVNYTKITTSDANGIEHVLYPAHKTSNPTDIGQDANGDYATTTTTATPSVTTLDTDNESETWDNYSTSNPNSIPLNSSSSQNPSVDNNNMFNQKGRYGIDPQFSQSNGSFYIDCNTGKIHFSSNLAGRTIILHYLSDHHGVFEEQIVHKFAEEAMYKHIAYGCAQARTDVPAGTVQRLKQERFAETRKAKIRLSNIKIEEITQIMRGKSKFIKH